MRVDSSEVDVLELTLTGVLTRSHLGYEEEEEPEEEAAEQEEPEEDEEEGEPEEIHWASSMTFDCDGVVRKNS